MTIHLKKRLFRLSLILLIPIVFASSAFSTDYFWVGGSGNWSDFQNHWATTSGGSSFHPIPPTQNDDVFFDQNSFSAQGQVVTLNTSFAYAKTIDWTGAQYNPTWAGETELNIFGSLILAPVMLFDFTNINTIFFRFRGDQPGMVIHTFGHRIAHPDGAAYFEFSGQSGEWTLQSDLDVGYFNNLGNVLVVMGGSLITQGFQVSAGEVVFHTTTSDHIDLDTSLVLANSIWFTGADSSKFDADSSVFDCNQLVVECPGNYHFATVKGRLAGPTLNDVARFDEIRIFDSPLASNLQDVVGNFLFRDLFQISDSGRTLNMQGRFEVLDRFLIDSKPGFPIRIQGNSEFVKAGSDLCFEWLYLENSSAGGGANWYAGLQSSDLGGNTGWNFSTSDSCKVLVSNDTPIAPHLDAKWFPSPSNNHSGLHISFTLPNTEEVILELWNMQGQLQWRHRGLRRAGTHHFQVPIQDLAAGTYLGTLQTATGFAKQVIVHH